MQKRALFILLATSLLLASNGRSGSAEEAGKSPLGQKVHAFELKDFRGKSYLLDDFKTSRAIVLVFLGTECPLAGQYAPRLVQLANRFADKQVTFLAIDSNQQDSLSELAEFAKTHEINFPLLKDVGNVVADSVGAVRTPEVFVLDEARVVRYWGRIDDQYIVGRQRKKPTREDLAEALGEVLAGREVSQGITEALGCRIGRVKTPQANAQVTYSKHIAPLLNSRCVECHRPSEIAPFSLANYAEVVGWAETIAEVIADNRMPPWHANPEHGNFSNDRRLKDEEKQLVYDWVKSGAPEGNPKDLPAPPQFAEGWRLPRVDQEIFMGTTAYNVPAEGAVEYQYFTVDPGFTEDKWVQAAECRPGNRAVVHHIIVGIRPGPGKSRHRPGGMSSEWLTATAPGARPLLLADGMAKFVPAGSKLVFQMHYTPNGTPQKDLSSVALMFADASKVRQEVITLGIENHFIFIPPSTPDYQADAWQTLRRDTLLLSLFPHMHLRGKAFRYEAKYPDGTTEILLDVPRYDFAWQGTYELAQPKLLPKGTQLHCVAHYDNSPENIANPNPNRVVHWGDQTWDEMMIGYLDVTFPDAPAKVAAKKSGK